MTLTSTHTRTRIVTRFADPYKRCTCGVWITGAVGLHEDGPALTWPCLHPLVDIRDLCPSWGFVDGCTCGPVLGAVRHDVPAEVEPGQVL